MAYCSTVDVKNFIPASVVQQLSDDNDTDAIDAEKVTFCTSQADDLIDGYLRGRYPVPLVTVPTMIRDLSVRLTVYFLFKRSLYHVLPDPIKEDYSYIIKTLIGMQQGKINAFPAANEPTFFGTNKQASDKVFTMNPVLPVLTPSMTTTQRGQGQNNWNSYPI